MMIIFQLRQINFLSCFDFSAISPEPTSLALPLSYLLTLIVGLGSEVFLNFHCIEIAQLEITNKISTADKIAL